MKIDSLDHLVLTVADVDATCRFYVDVLGMEALTFGEGRKALQFGTQKINLHQVQREFEPKAHRATPGSADLCFLSSTPIAEIKRHVEQLGVSILAGPVQRTGAQGPIMSLYLRDPDENLIEVSNRIECANEAAHFILYVSDQAASARFYTHTLAIEARLNVPGMTEFDLPGGAVLGLMPKAGIRELLGSALPTGEGGEPKAELYLVVGDPTAFHARAVQAGARELSRLTPRDWGHEVAYSLDPDAHVIAFARCTAH